MLASIRDIKLFVAAYEERSFTAAAVREAATQSGVSQRIAKLEALLQVKLFCRNAAGLAPTPAADAYYGRCVDILRVHGTAHSVLGNYAHGLHGEICVGLMPSMTRCVLAPALAKFIDEHPNVAVRVVEGYSGVLTRQVKAGELEFAIVPAFSETVGLRSRRLATTPELLVSRKCGMGRGPRTIRLSDQEPLKLVVPSRGNARRMLLDKYFASNGVRIERVMELDAMFGTLGLISETDWAAVLPAVMMSEEADHRKYNVRVICDPPLSLDLMLIEASRRPMSLAAEAFLKHIENEMDRINRVWETAPGTVARQPIATTVFA